MTEDSRRPFCTLAGQDGEIDAFELKDILNKVFQRGSYLLHFMPLMLHAHLIIVVAVIAGCCCVKLFCLLIVFSDFKFEGFTVDLTRSMVAMSDVSFDLVS